MVYTLESIVSRDSRFPVSEIDIKRITDRFDIVWLKLAEPMLIHCITEPTSMFTTSGVINFYWDDKKKLTVTTRQSIFTFKETANDNRWR
jgi:hypothetical protein